MSSIFKDNSKVYCFCVDDMDPSANMNPNQ